MPDPTATLELTPADMRAMGQSVLDRVVSHIASLDEQPSVGDVRAEALCQSLKEPAPEEGTPLEPLLDRLFEEWIPRSITTAGPGYLGYIPGGGLFPAALADFITNGVNRFTGVWFAAPALVQLEANALDWIRDWMGFPAEARGLFTTGGSMANFNAVLCARERRLGADIRPGVLYTSTHAHHSIVKAAKLAGVMRDRVRNIEVDGSFRMRLDRLSEAIEADRAQGLVPFMVVSSAGTVNTGAVDPMDEIGALCRRAGLWHHVDGAYGGFFHVCPELRPLLAGLSAADSVTLDPHKGLFLPYGTGALVVRDGQALRAVHAMAAGYLPGAPDPDEFYDPSQYGPDLTRGFPGLRVWLSVKLFGAARLRAAVAEKRALAVSAAGRLARVPGLVIVSPPQLSLFAFHLTWPGASLEDENRATRALLDRVNARGRVFLSGTGIDDRYLARVCVLSFRTRAEQIDTCIEHLSEEAAVIVAARGRAAAV